MLSVRSHLLREDVREGIVQVPVELEPLFFERLLHEDVCFSQTSRSSMCSTRRLTPPREKVLICLPFRSLTCVFSSSGLGTWRG
jgi:hypothetical protein